MVTVAQCLQRSSELYAICDSADLDTKLLLAYCMNRTTTDLITWPECLLTTKQTDHFESLFERRRAKVHNGANSNAYIQI